MIPGYEYVYVRFGPRSETKPIGHFIRNDNGARPHGVRQHLALGRPLRFECGIGLFDKLVKESPFRAMAFVFDQATILTGFPASRHLQHDRVPAMWLSLSLPNDFESSREIGR